MISPEMITFAGESLHEALIKLFNLCIIHGFVPDNFSKSVIVPVVKDKNGKTDCIDNYRPVSLVSMFSKVFELCVSDRLVILLCVDDLQFGFVSSKGCQKRYLPLIQLLTCLLVVEALFLWLLLMPVKLSIE